MNTTHENYADTTFDDQLNELRHYQLYPEMIPFIGSHYRRMNKRVLVIGESHYLEEGKKIQEDLDDWYAGSTAHLLDDVDRDWIHTRGTSGSGVNQKYLSKAFGIYRNVEYAIRDLLEGEAPHTDNYLRYAAYYNYFQRPAKTGLSLHLDSRDKDVAYDHLASLVKVLQPTHLAFVSKLAHNSFWEKHPTQAAFDVRDIFGTPHPGCSWWNRSLRHYFYEEQEVCTGREWFLRRVGRLRIE